MHPRTSSDRAAELAQCLREASAGLIAVVEPIDRHQWRLVPHPGVWSISTDVEHVAEAAVYHQWIVQLTIGLGVPSRRPVIERAQMTSDLSPVEAAGLLRRRTDEGVRVLLDLTDEHLDLPTRPPRAKAPVLAQTIQWVLIGHYNAHRADIEAKLRALG